MINEKSFRFKHETRECLVIYEEAVPHLQNNFNQVSFKFPFLCDSVEIRPRCATPNRSFSPQRDTHLSHISQRSLVSPRAPPTAPPPSPEKFNPRIQVIHGFKEEQAKTVKHLGYREEETGMGRGEERGDI